MKKRIIFDTSIASHNMGDNIIMHYMYNMMNELFPDDCFVKLATHEYMGKSSRKLYRDSDFSLVGGTNLLTSKMIYNPQWKLNIIDMLYLREVVLVGVGWSQYDKDASFYTKRMLNSVLSKRYSMSVRDSYTKEKLLNAGISNVINTSCITTWNLTPAFCKMINRAKSDNVITTVTNYRKNIQKDKFMLDTLRKNYENVYLWIQSISDYDYLKSFYDLSNIIIIPPNLNSFELMLEVDNIDYIGTRLHAGIHALNHGIRSLIIGVDNRALEIARDINLPVINRNDIEENFDNYIFSFSDMDIQIPVENINKWKNQFK